MECHCPMYEMKQIQDQLEDAIECIHRKDKEINILTCQSAHLSREMHTARREQALERSARLSAYWLKESACKHNDQLIYKIYQLKKRIVKYKWGVAGLLCFLAVMIVVFDICITKFM